jgi:hypothetical protein
MKFNLDFDIALGKWVLFSILILVILYGSYYSLFGLREGFAPGTCRSLYFTNPCIRNKLVYPFYPLIH